MTVVETVRYHMFTPVTPAMENDLLFINSVTPQDLTDINKRRRVTRIGIVYYHADGLQRNFSLYYGNKFMGRINARLTNAQLEVVGSNAVKSHSSELVAMPGEPITIRSVAGNGAACYCKYIVDVEES